MKSWLKAAVVLVAAAFTSCGGRPKEPLEITTEDKLPDATATYNYTADLDAKGGNPPYHWSVKTGELPPGVTLDPKSGELSGVPEDINEEQTWEVEIEVTDSPQ